MKHPEITVEVDRDAQTPEDVTITVSDKGPALDDEAFAAFTARLAAMETTKKDGLGLGFRSWRRSPKRRAVAYPLHEAREGDSPSRSTFPPRPRQPKKTKRAATP